MALQAGLLLPRVRLAWSTTTVRMLVEFLVRLGHHNFRRCVPMHPHALVLALASLSSSAFAQYEVRLGAGGQPVSISLALPPGAGEPLKLATRGAGWGLKPQVSDVRCGDLALPQDADGNWLAPADCRQVTWRVVPDPVPAEGVDASEQRTLALAQGRWILLAEPTSLLRPSGADGASTIRSAPGAPRMLGATPVGAGAFKVPPVHSGPEFYVLGEASTSQRKLGRLAITYVADSPARVKQLGLEALHAAALRYLTRVVPEPQTATPLDRSLLVVWLGVSESRGGAGGAAGSRSFLANYVLGSASNSGRNTALTTLIAAHEQFHQLVDVLRSDLPPQPSLVWLNESIAHYYGLKALLVADPSPPAKDVWDRFIDRQRVIEHGLLELNRRYEAGDQAVYGLFYSQGATFWHEVDTAIKTATGGDKSLDDYLVELLRGTMETDGSLSTSFIDQLRQVAGGSIDQILAKYVTKAR